MEINKKNRSELKKYFLANMIPLEGHFAALIDAGINQAEDGMAKPPGSPLSLQAEGEPSGTLDILHLFRSFEDEAPSWMLNLNPEVDPDDPEGNQPGLNIKDVNGISRFFLKEKTGQLGLGTITPKGNLDVRNGTIYAGSTDNITGDNPQAKILLNHTSESHDKGHAHGAIGWIGTGRDMSTNLSASIAAGSNTWDDQGYLSFATSDGADHPKERLRITESGLVGIGLDTPSEMLEVAGTVKATQFIGDGSRLTNLSLGETGLNLAIDRRSRVGIGTSSPKYKLEVSGGDARINDLFIGDVGHGAHWAGLSHGNVIGPESYGFMQSADGTSTLINKKSGGGYIGLRVDNTDKMVLLDNGQVGIGTKKPIHQFEVHGDKDVVLFKSNKDSMYLRLANNEGLENRVEFANRKGGRAAIWVAGAGDALTVTKAGKVGIGLTDPSEQLEIAGTVKATQFVGDGSGLTNLGMGESKLNLALEQEEKMGIGTDSPTQKFEVAGGNATINNAFIGDVGHGEDWAGFSHNNAIDPKSYGFLQSASGVHTLINKTSGGGYIGFRVDNNDKMVLLDNGHVGIGLTDPSEQLEVAGTVKATQFVGDGSGLTNLGIGESKLNLALETEEKVGIGTTNPKHKFEVHGDSDVALFQSTLDTMYLRLANKDGMDSRVEFANRKGGRAAIWVAKAGDAFIVTKEGQVGIGVTQPSEQLEVAGTVKATEFVGDGSRLTNLGMGEAKLNLALEREEKVGIGTTNPKHKFEVHGDSDVALFQSTLDTMYLRLANKDGMDSRVEFANRKGGRATIWVAKAGDAFNVTKEGLVGIGTDQPKAALSLQGDGKESTPDSSMHITDDCILFGGKNAGKELHSAQISAGKHEPNSLNIVGMSSDKKPNTRKVHVWAEGGMLVNGVVTAHDFRKHSDRRIKKEVKVSDQQADLATLMKIQIADYQFVDQDRYDELPQKKIIAQQVLEVYPTAVSNKTTEVVPDIFKEANMENGEILLEDHGLRIGEKVKITLEDVDEDEDVPMNEIYEVIEASIDTFKVSTKASGKVFIYGREVNDFCTVDVDALAMLNISATQALHQRLDQLTKDYQALEQKYEQLS